MPKPFTLDRILRHGVVFPSEQPILLQGSAPNGRTVRVAFLTFRGSAKAANGRFQITIPPMGVVDTPFSITFRMGFQTQIVKDCLIGDVYLMIGGSEMWRKESVVSVSCKENSQVRVLSVPETFGGSKDPDVSDDGWQWSDHKETSSLARRFACELQSSVRRPIGVVVVARPNAGVLSMMNPADFYRHHRFEALARETLRAYQAKEAFERPGGLFEDLLKPVAGIAFAGIVFAQDLLDPMPAELLEDALRIAFFGWRRLFDKPSLPIIIAQFADCLDQCPSRERHALIREAQMKTVDAKKQIYLVTSAVFEQIGSDATVAHGIVAERLVKAVLEKIYKRGRNLLSPGYYSHTKKNGVVIYTDFNWLPLVSRSKKNLGFAVSFDGETFEPVTDVTLILNQIVLGGVEKAKEIRYDFSDRPLSDIGTQNGLPLLPFRLRLN